MAEAFKVSSDKKEIGKMIANLKARGGAFVADVQICATSIVFHAIEHGQVTPATQLCKELPDMFNVEGLRGWFEANGPFSWDEEKKAFFLDYDTKERFEDEYSKDAKALETRLLATSIGIVPEKTKTTKTVKAFDFDKELTSLLDKATKLLKKAEGEKIDTQAFRVFRGWVGVGFKDLKSIPTLNPRTATEEEARATAH